MSESAGLSSPEPLPQSFLGRFAPASMISECYPTHVKISQQKISSQQLFQQSNHSKTSSTQKTSPGTSSSLPPLRARPLAVCKPSEPDHKMSIFSFHLCSTNCAPEIWEKKRDLTDEKDSDPLVVGIVQLLTIVVSFAAMTLVWGNISGPVPNDLKGHNVSDTWCYKQIMDNEILSNHILALKWPWN